MTRQRHIVKRKLGLWLGMAALAVQALLPLLIAVEVRIVSADPFLFGIRDPALICSQHRDSRPSLPTRHDLAACPLCAALAAGHATTLTAAAALTPPRDAAIPAGATPAPVFSVYRQAASYDATGPPARA